MKEFICVSRGANLRRELVAGNQRQAYESFLNPPCDGRSEWVELAEVSRPMVRAAAITCATCPLLLVCNEDLERRLESSSIDVRPVDQLQAGRFFDEFGHEVSGRRYMGVYKKFRALMSARLALETVPQSNVA